MKGEEHLNKPEQFTLVYKNGCSQADRLLVIKALQNRLEFSRYGISVSKRVGQAVVRNRIKRRIREILRLRLLDSGWDIIIIARSPAAGSDFHQLEKSLCGLLSRAHIVAK
jgi:ribonuclease P protein component